MTKTEILNMAIEAKGATHQEIIAIEECSELIQAITHKHRGRKHNLAEEIAEVTAVLQSLVDNGINYAQKRKASDIGNVHTVFGNDELPAGGNYVVSRVLVLVAETDKSGNYHVIIGILRKTKPLHSESGSEFVALGRCVFINAQIDLGVDHAKLLRRRKHQL